MTLDEIKADIIGACEEFKAAGYELRHSFGLFDEAGGKLCSGCALTAVAVMREGRSLRRGWATTDTLKAVYHRYGWDSGTVADFVGGFDNDGRGHGDSDAFRIGKEVREAVKPVE